MCEEGLGWRVSHTWWCVSQCSPCINARASVWTVLVLISQWCLCSTATNVLAMSLVVRPIAAISVVRPIAAVRRCLLAHLWWRAALASCPVNQSTARAFPPHPYRAPLLLYLPTPEVGVGGPLSNTASFETLVEYFEKLRYPHEACES